MNSTNYRCVVCGALGPFSLWYNTKCKFGLSIVRMCEYCGPRAKGYIRNDLNKYGVEV